MIGKLSDRCCIILGVISVQSKPSDGPDAPEGVFPANDSFKKGSRSDRKTW